jgi:hypothetical protein
MRLYGTHFFLRQLVGRYKASKEGGLAGLLAQAKSLLVQFKLTDIKHVYR